MVPSSSEDVTRALFSWRISLRLFVSFQSKAKPQTLWGCCVWYFDYKQKAKELWLTVCFNTFRDLNRSLIKRRMSLALTITTKWMAEKCLEKRVQGKRMPKHKLGNRTNIWSKYKRIQTIAAQLAESSLSNNKAKGNVD